MFKIGDKIWANNHRYSVTGYHRPCIVVNNNKLNSGRLLVRVIDTDKLYEVDSKEFELVTEEDIFNFGDILLYKGETLTFIKYQNYSTILCNRYDESTIRVEIKKVKKAGCFIV